MVYMYYQGTKYKPDNRFSNIFSKSNKSLTTITIAHRLIALTFCDKVIEIEEGKIKRILDSKDFNKELKMGLISESKGPSGK